MVLSVIVFELQLLIHRSNLKFLALFFHFIFAMLVQAMSIDFNRTFLQFSLIFSLFAFIFWFEIQLSFQYLRRTSNSYLVLFNHHPSLFFKFFFVFQYHQYYTISYILNQQCMCNWLQQWQLFYILDLQMQYTFDRMPLLKQSQCKGSFPKCILSLVCLICSKPII